MTEGDDDYNEVLNWYNEYKKEKGEKIAEIKNIIEKLYPDTRPKKKSRRSSGAATDVPSARFTARNSTFRSANRMLRTFRHEDSVTFRETRNRWFIRIKKSQTRTPTPHAGFGTLTEQSPQGGRCELLQEATSSVSA